jgi:hypothetical protein
MTTADYLAHTYRFIPAADYHAAVSTFYKKYGYVPAPVFGHPGCGDALESNYVAPGIYACAIRREAAQSPHEPVKGNCPWQACFPCDLAGQVGCDQTCRYYPYDGRQE